MYEDDPNEAVKQCQLLLDEPDLETAVRLGDVYGFVIEHYASEENYKQVCEGGKSSDSSHFYCAIGLFSYGGNASENSQS